MSNPTDLLAAQSPSLKMRPADRLPSYELKFLATVDQANRLAGLLAEQLMVDPHAGPEGSYHITTLYCDTPERHVFRRRGRFGLMKFRLRQYGDSAEMFLERTLKRGTVVRKLRTQVPLADIGRFGGRPDEGWGGFRFHQQLRRCQMSPVCLVEYDREAWYGILPEGTVRATIDRNLTGSPVDEWSLSRPADQRPFLVNYGICEFKFRGVMPALVQRLIESLELAPVGVSKYRNCVRTWELQAKEPLVEPYSPEEFLED
jgi:(2Fe-2S) ferredoxin